jgi:hypothetical protein
MPSIGPIRQLGSVSHSSDARPVPYPYGAGVGGLHRKRRRTSRPDVKPVYRTYSDVSDRSSPAVASPGGVSATSKGEGSKSTGEGGAIGGPPCQRSAQPTQPRGTSGQKWRLPHPRCDFKTAFQGALALV